MARGQAKSEMPAKPGSRAKSSAQEKSAPAKSGRRDGQDAIALLTEDHKAVQAMFKAFVKLQEEDGSDEEKAELVQQTCAALTVHTQIEEEIFYPQVREAIDDSDLLDEAEVEHATAKDLIEQLEVMEPGDELYDARFTVLGEYVNHHIKEEQDELFPEVRAAKMDLAALGAELADRKKELLAELSLESDTAEDADDDDDEDDDDDDANDSDDEDEDDDDEAEDEGDKAGR